MQGQQSESEKRYEPQLLAFAGLRFCIFYASFDMPFYGEAYTNFRIPRWGSEVVEPPVIATVKFKN